jgi:hypothetical protein
MDVSVLVSIFAVLVFPLGWLATNVLNQAKEVRQRRLELRLEMLHSFLPVWFEIQKYSTPFSNSDFLPQLETARSNFHLYGHKDEIEKMEKFIKAFEEKNINSTKEALAELVPLVRNRIRKEIRISS